jgi:DNA ligase D-like protein (predicted ligase)
MAYVYGQPDGAIAVLPKRMPVPEVANHLVCTNCGAGNSETYNPIWARPDARVSDAIGRYPDYSKSEFSYTGPDMLRSAFSTGPRFIKPELPTLVSEPPTGEGWIHEIKYDGYRTLIAIDRGKVRAFTRNGFDWTTAYRRPVEASAKLACETALMDGEVVVQDENGISDFEALLSAIHKAPHRLVFYAFDLLYLDSQDLRGQPLIERRELLRKLIRPDKRSAIQFSDHLEGDGAKFFKAAAELGLEGIVSKRAASRYRSGPSRSWLKTKNMVESEFVLLGTELDSDGVPWALLASDRDGELRFAGPAILNPPQALRAAWRERMSEFALAKPPLRGLRQGSALWLRPELRVRVRHLNTKGVLRHATVRQLITD